jgi:hypothetical protein
MVSRQLVEHALPDGVRPGDSVDQQQGRALAGHPEGHGVPVELDRVATCGFHLLVLLLLNGESLWNIFHRMF